VDNNETTDVCTHRQTDIFRHSTLRYVGERFIRTPTFDVFGHFAGRPVSANAFFLAKPAVFCSRIVSTDL